MLELESEKRNTTHGQINFGEALCLDAFDDNDAARLTTWRINASTYIRKTTRWWSCGTALEKVTRNDFDTKAAAEGWDDDQGHAEFSKILNRFLLAKTSPNANWIVQHWDSEDGVNAWRRPVCLFDPYSTSLSQCHLKMTLSFQNAKEDNEVVSSIQMLWASVRKMRRSRTE